MKKSIKSRFWIVMTLGMLMGPTSLAADAKTGEIKRNLISSNGIRCDHNMDKVLSDHASDQAIRGSSVRSSGVARGVK